MSASNESDTVMAQMLKNLHDANREIGRLEQLCRLSEAIIPSVADDVRKGERKRIVQELNADGAVNGIGRMTMERIIGIVRGEINAAD